MRLSAHKNNVVRDVFVQYLYIENGYLNVK